MSSLYQELLPKGGGVITLVGGGGKTTLMFRLAAELASIEEMVLTTTTTKIFEPSKKQSAHIVVSEAPEEVLRKSAALLHHSPHVTAARERLVSLGKLAGFEPAVIKTFMEKGPFRWILVEGDGAARKPLKAPAEHEPVIPECSTCVIAVVGLDVIGQPLDDRWVFRAELYSNMTGIPLGSPVTEGSVTRVILDDSGLMKGCPPEARRIVFLNKAEGERRLSSGKIVATLLKEQGRGKLDKVLIGSAEKGSVMSMTDV
jgi:probable selenium-dependent hydroxylase accessory protein YqeC